MIRSLTILLFTTVIMLIPDIAVWGGETEKTASQVIDWNNIKVLDLDTAKQIAFAANPSLEAAEMRVRQAQERVKQTRALYYPRFDLTASASRIRLSDNAYQAISQSGRDNPENRYKTGMTANWVLFNGFERRFTHDGALIGEKESRQAQKDARRLLASALAKAYYRGLLARENIAILNADEKFNQRQIDDAETRRNVGTGSLSDVLNFKVQINASRSERNQVELNYANAIYALAALMGTDHTGLPANIKLGQLESEAEKALFLPDSKPLINYALKYRPDIIQGEYALKRSQAEYGAARARFYPNLNLTAALDGDRDGSASLEYDDFGDVITLNLSYNLFAGGADKARLAETRLQIKEARKNLTNIKNIVVSEVRDALAGLKAGQAELRLQRANASLVQQNRDLVEKEYAVGEGSLVRLNEAQRDMIKAQSRLALARVGLRQAWHNLKVSTAEILEDL
jgi:outer membrane protein TolC